MYSDATAPANQYGCQAGEAWAAGNTGSSEVWVGIIDESYMYTHEDLAANAAKNPSETSTDNQGGDKETNSIDDDGNEYVDDVYG